jgi:23S rRNA pseudouridine1911/1915/1917 synthase
MSSVDFEEEDYSPSALPNPAAAAVQTVTLKVPLALGGRRLDQVLAELLPDYSRNRLAAMIKADAVEVDGASAAPKLKLLGGENIVAHLSPREEENAFKAENVPLQVLFEDDSILVIDKPPGLVVHPAAGNWSGTVLNGLLFRNAHVAHLARAGIVHRLDKDTSGVMVAAKTEAAQFSLVQQLQARSMKRQYLALVRGHVDDDGTVDAPVGRHPRERTRMAVVDEYHGGKPAITHYRVLERYDMHTLLECRLETGRTHQIRVHMQSIGFPLEADPIYGPRRVKLDAALQAAIDQLGRQALHARRLTLTHPVEQDTRVFEAPIPADLQRMIDFVSAM